MRRRQIVMSYSNLKWIGRSCEHKKPKRQAYLVEEKNFSGISNLLITSSTYLENVFLFTLIETVELLFLFIQGSRPSFGNGGCSAFGDGGIFLGVIIQLANTLIWWYDAAELALALFDLVSLWLSSDNYPPWVLIMIGHPFVEQLSYIQFSLFKVWCASVDAKRNLLC